MNVALLLVRGRGQGRTFPVNGQLVTLGRGEGCDLRIPLGEVSRKHCTLLIADDAIRVQDLGSSNGTHVNGRRVQEARLSAGDVLRIGSLTFVLQVNDSPTAEEARASLAAPPAPAAGDSGEAASGEFDALHPTAQADAADFALDPSAAAEIDEPA